jgi:hypothetical protein
LPIVNTVALAVQTDDFGNVARNSQLAIYNCMRPSPLTTAPSFELPNQKGQIRSLSGLLEKGPVLLVFHRGTW